MPARGRFCLATSVGTRTRTGSRCTILVKLPVALSGGSSVNTEPAAGEMLSTTPANLRWPWASTEIFPRWRGGRNAVDHAGELAMAVGVDRNFHRLAGADALELGFLVVGIDEDVVERHE